MKELITEILNALTMMVKSVLSLAEVSNNIAQSAVHVSAVVKDSAEAFELTEQLENADRIRELRSKYQTKAQSDE